MTDTPDEPNWSLLPQDPVGFFGLSVGFDGRELKRCYNQLIRRFKPERFPQEFQRIRAAYEQLQNANAYGQSTDSSAPVDLFEWDPSAVATTASSSVALPLHQRIQTGSATEIYRELKDQANKSPQDYYALAVMSDVVDPQDGQQFANWILQGLTAYRNEIGLSRLLHAYFSGLVESKHCESLLVACSRIVREDLFFPLTEPLWKLLLRSQDFSHFREVLAQCEANLKGINIDNRLSFYLRILKPAVWVADEEWINQSYNLIEQHFDRIPKFLDYELEILSRLRAYIQIREQFIQGDEVRRRLDQAIRDYFSEDQLAGDQGVVACQVAIAQDTERVSAAFAELGDQAYPRFYALWQWVSYDVGERNVEPSRQSLHDNVWQSRMRTLLVQLARRTDRSRLGLQWGIWTVMYYLSTAACYVLPIILLELLIIYFWSGSRANDTSFDLLFVGGAVGGLYSGRLLQKQLRSRVWLPYCLRISARCYRQLWSREIISFLARSHLSYQMLNVFLNSEAGINIKGGWVKYYVDQDYALPVYAIAQQFAV